MENQKSLFEKFSDDRLIDIVKNAKQFGYDDNIKDLALQILKERGITEEDLQLTGNLSNHKFDYAYELYGAYNKNSQIAFVSYLLALILKTIAIFHLFGMDDPGTWYIILYWLIVAVFTIALVKSFFNHLNFYKAVGKELGTGDQIIFIVLGMPFYIFMFFFYKSRMKEEMQMIT